MRLSEPLFLNEEHTYYCTISDDRGNTFIGKAKCHPHDQEFESEKVGYVIASQRAIIKALKFEINNHLKPTLKVFNSLLDSMKQSKHFNKKSYETKRIFRTINNLELEIQTFKEMISKIEEELKQFLEEKDKFRASIRTLRNKGKIQ